MWRLLAGYDNTPQLQNCSLQGLFPLNRSESKKQMSFQDSPALVGLRGGSPRRVSWYKAILLRWDGLHLALQFHCTSVHCTCWNWTPLPAQCPSEMCHTLCYRVLASDTVAVREAEFTTLSGELARSSAAEQQCTKIHCTGGKKRCTQQHGNEVHWNTLRTIVWEALGTVWVEHRDRVRSVEQGFTNGREQTVKMKLWHTLVRFSNGGQLENLTRLEYIVMYITHDVNENMLGKCS